MDAVLISDLQIPFEHCDAIDFVLHIRDELERSNINKKIHIINMGDEVDQHTLGKYPNSPKAKSGYDEFEISKEKLSEWFYHFDRVRVCASNHSYRIFKRAFEVGIPEQFLLSIKAAYGAPSGWQWADRWIIDGICFEHGEHVSGKNAALLAAEQNGMPTAIGHQHSFGGVTYSNRIGGQIWGLNTGCLIDVDQYAFEYGKNLRKKPTLGCGVIINNTPFFVPMFLDKRKRWIKRTYFWRKENEFA